MAAKKKVLVADDDLKVLKALSIRLEAEEFEVITCQDAYQALEMARRNQPDALLLDVNMPAGNGFSVQERITKIKELANVPVIYITGDASEATDRNARKLGAYAVLHKPFNMAKLLETLRTAVGYWNCDPADVKLAS
jgi:DNA-binding response OmpR family regulator